MTYWTCTQTMHARCERVIVITFENVSDYTCIYAMTYDGRFWVSLRNSVSTYDLANISLLSLLLISKWGKCMTPRHKHEIYTDLMSVTLKSAERSCVFLSILVCFECPCDWCSSLPRLEVQSDTHQPFCHPEFTDSSLATPTHFCTQPSEQTFQSERVKHLLFMFCSFKMNMCASLFTSFEVNYQLSVET